MGFELVTPFSTNQNNVLKFFVSGLVLYPVLETLVSNMITRLATLSIILGQPVRLRSTRLGAFGPNIVYYGSKRWRVLILFIALSYSGLSLAGEFGFGSSDDVPRRGNFLKRTSVNMDQFRDMTVLVSRHKPVVAGGYLSCFSMDPAVSIRNTPYPREFSNADRARQLQWCNRLRSQLSFTNFKRFREAEFSRHCSEVHDEHVKEFELQLNGSFVARPLLARRLSQLGWQLRCEANENMEGSVFGFTSGALSVEGNQHFLRHEMFSLKHKFSLAIHRIPTEKMITTLRVQGTFVKGARYFANERLACVELKLDLKLLCIVRYESSVRDKYNKHETIRVNFTEWHITKGKGVTKNENGSIVLSGPISEMYEIRPSGLIMHLAIAPARSIQVRTMSYKMLLALYDIMQLPGIVDIYSIYSVSKERFNLKRKYSQETNLNFAKIIFYRMLSDKVQIEREKTEIAYERTGFREFATMNVWAVFFYVTPVVGVVTLILINIFLSIRIRNAAAAIGLAYPYATVTQHRVIAATVRGISTEPAIRALSPRSSPDATFEDAPPINTSPFDDQDTRPPLIGIIGDGMNVRIGFLPRGTRRQRQSLATFARGL